MNETNSGGHALDVFDYMTKAVALHRRGDLNAARQLYTDILDAHPNHFDVLHCLGVLEIQLGHHEEAHRLLGQALNSNPGSPEARLNFGNALRALKRPDAALESYDLALAIRPDYAEAFNNRGNTLLELGRHAEALASYDKALTVAPGHADAWFNRGVVLQELGRHEEALASYERVLAIQPDYAEAHTNRGNVLQSLKRHAEALTSYDRVLALAPNFAPALNNRGNALRDLGRYEEALASYEKALVVAPDYADAYFNLGLFFQKFKRRQEELASYDKALAVAPGHAGALYMRGITLQTLNRQGEAIRDFEQVLKLDPPGLEFSDTRGNLLYSKMRACDWRHYDEEMERVVAGVRGGKCSIQPFPFLAVSDSVQDQQSCSRIWTGDKFPVSPAPVWKGERYRHDRIRIAYLSSDLRDHPVAYLMAGLFELHDRARFETIAISYGDDKPGEMRSRLQAAFERFIDVREKSDRDVANLLRELEVDIAVDLNGYTTDNRTGIFALRPAPVQVNYLGYPGTQGAGYIDYIFADRHTIPDECKQSYDEKAVYLPDTFQANDRKRRIAERRMTRAEAGLPEHGFVFCCFNNNYKVTPAVFDVWMRLLDKTGGSVLWLIQGDALVETNLRREAQLRGINSARLVFAPRMQYEEHLARYRLADLFLDTLPFNAGATASDALWGGLPVLTCQGEAFAARMAGSLLHAVGLPELITNSLDQYEALAIKLASDPAMLASLKAKLAANHESYPLFNTDRFRRHVEAAYVTMWERSQRGEAPVSFAVEPMQ